MHERPTRRPTRAVVLGGSLAGLLSARVLADHVDEVVVVDRDDLDADLAAPRRGVPQGGHTHALLVRGTEVMEDLLPGFTEELSARGARRGDLLQRSHWLVADNLLADGPSGLVGLGASRTLVESQVRRRVRRTRGVRLLGGHDVTGVLASTDRRRIVGVRITPRGARTTAPAPTEPVEMAADLVVDATGRGSRAPAWCRDLGYAVPEQTRVDARLVYMTRLFRARPGDLDDLDGVVVGARPPHGRSGVALRQEGGRWTVTLAGQHGEEPPADLPGFLAFARTLPGAAIARVVATCPAIGEAERYRFPFSRWVRWERLAARPEGLVVIGDAVCSFNPVYGQGMSSVALQVRRLGELLAEGGTAALAERSAAAFAEVVAAPWLLATGADRRFPGMPPKPVPQRVLDRYLDRLTRVATADHEITVAFTRVLNLVEPPASLLAPRIAYRVLGPGSAAIVRDAARAQAARTAHRRQKRPQALPVGRTLGADQESAQSQGAHGPRPSWASPARSPSA